MLYKVFLAVFLSSTMTFVMWMMFTIRISDSDHKLEPIKFRRYLQARMLVTRNDTYYQRGISRIVTGLKREYSSTEIVYDPLLINKPFLSRF